MNKDILDIVVAGAGGRVGQAILKIAGQTPGIRVAGALEMPGHPWLGRDAGEIGGGGRLGVRLESDAARTLARGSVLIDFTTPEATLRHLDTARKLGKQMVIGTTGLTPPQLKTIRAFSRQNACVLSSNFSVGVNLLWKALETIAKKTGDDFDVEIIETHHRHKKDSPSGTALTTAALLAKGLGRNLPRDARYGRGPGMIGARSSREIGIHAVRGGDIVGDHTVLFAGKGESLEFTHRALNRENFAVGAIRAALWLRTKKNGLYSMKEVLGL
jgi:4-hydroxy-tetrahydrodipicolinate reductase